MTRRLSILVPILGLLIVVVWVTVSARKVQHVAALASPPVSPYEHAIAATGIVEASNRNYNLAPPVSGELTAIYVKEGDSVHRGDKLYSIDARPQRAALQTAAANVSRARAQIQTARSSVEMQQANLNSAAAAIDTARATYDDAKQIADRDEGLHKEGIISEEQYISSIKTRDADMARYQQAIAQQRQAQAQLDNARSQVGEQQANLQSTVATRDQEGAMLDQLTVRAPADGRILQVNNRAGEYLSSTAGTTPVLFGDIDSLMVRVDVDEINASHVLPNSEATATLKGDPSRNFPLQFVRIVPYMVPKENLTGQNSERVDVRVLQLEFRFTPPSFPVYVGQQVDVFIQSPQH
ncbi:MAG TPA: biotin/lipoyl-binding protein [Acidisarcina sp.]